MGKLSISLLGPFNTVLEGEAAPSFRTNKAQALLIYLAAEQTQPHPAPPRRETIMELLWPDMPDGSARQNLRQTLYLLRKDLAEVNGKDGELVPLLHSDRQIIQLNPDAHINIDIAQFQEHLTADSTKDLQEAASLYRGEFLADFYLPDSSSFESWAANYRSILRNQAIGLLETLWARHMRRTRYDLAEQAARRQLEIDELQESAHRQLIEALARSGQQSLALAQYDICRNLLQDELGVEPALETQQLMVAVRDGNLKAVSSPFAVRGYELRESIGEGGFGIVYRAIQSAVGREVAIKAIRRRFADDPDFIRRFEAEAHLVARLESPHIVPLYDFWREPGGAFLVMRWMRGGSLSESLQNGAWSLETAVKLVDQIANALETAHRQGIVHRDLKPGNILLDETGNAYLTDFGIAKDLASDQSFTAEGDFLGSPYYITPEQLLNESISSQTDIYSFGLTLYYLLVGEKPFGQGTPAAIIQKQINDPIPSARIQLPELPPAVDDVIQKATAKDPTQRFSNVSEMAEAFRSAVLSQNGDQIIVPAAEKSIVNPYKGLRPFEEADAGRFFGRQQLIEQLLAHLEDNCFLALVGPSGSGKSSVVKAGLIPALRRGALPGSEDWFIAEMIPGTHPLEELEAALFRVAVNPPPTLLPQLREDERGLVRAVKRILPPGGGEMLLLVDQFEELFTLVDDEERRRFFLNSLAAAASDVRGRIKLVLTLRADFYDRPLMYQAFGQLMRDFTEAIVPPTRADLADAIRKPAEQSGVEVEDALQTRMIADVYDRPGALPLLQYALTELFERRQDNLMTLANYESIDGVSGALANRAETLYQKLDVNGQATAQQLFLRLVTLGEGMEDTRRRVLRSELETVRLISGNLSTAEMVDLINKIIDQYGRYRLLSFDNDPATRAPTVEVAHEALLNAWPRFREWIAINRDGLRQQRRLSRWAAEWIAADRDPGLLLRESRLDQMAGWMAETELALSDNEAEYLEMSIQARQERIAADEARHQRELDTVRQLANEEQTRADEQAQAAKKLRRRAGYLTIALVAAGILALAALFLGGQANANEQLAQNNAATAVAESNQRATAQAEAEFQGEEAQAQEAIAVSETEQRATAQAQAESERQIAFSRELAAAAQANLNQDPELSIILALKALAITHTIAAENALHQAVATSHTKKTLYGLEPYVLAYSPDGTQLITGSDNGAIIWDVASGEELHTLSGHESTVSGVSFDRDNRRVATAGWDGTVHLWDASSGEHLLTLNDNMEWVADIDFSPDDRLLATGGDKTNIWDLETSQALMTIPEGGDYVAFSPDGQLLAVSSADNAVKIFDVTTGEELLILLGHSDFVNGLSFSPDGLMLATESNDSTIRLWQMDKNSPDTFGQELMVFFGAKNGSGATSVNFTPDGKQLLAVGADRRIKVWDLDTGQELPSFICHLAADAMAISPDGKHVAVAVAGGDESIKICHLGQTYEWLTIAGHSDWIYKSDFSHDGTTLYTAGRDGAIKGWDLTKPGTLVFGQEQLILEIENNRYYEVKVSPDGSKLAAAGFDDRVRVWDIASGQEEYALLHDDSVLSLDYSPDGSKLATASLENNIIVWDANTGQQLKQMIGHSDWTWGLEFSPDGSLLATASLDSTVKIWDVNFGQEVMNLVHPDWMFDVAFSPDGRYLAAAGSEGVIQVWDMASAKDDELSKFQRLSGHDGLITDLDFNHDGSMLASAGFDNTTRVWDLNTGQEHVTLTGHNDVIRGVTFSPDGTLLASTSGDSTARIHLLDIDQLIELAQNRISRSMTTAECQRYLHLENCPKNY